MLIFKRVLRKCCIFVVFSAVLLLMAGCSSGSNPAGSGGGNGDGDKNISYTYFTDERDGKTYKTVKIGDDVWMAENLNYAPTWQGEESWCYDDKSVNCGKYGRLYTWDAAMEACPYGWHLPSNEEWERLFYMAYNAFLPNNASDTYEVNYETSFNGSPKLASREWYGGTNDFGFSALPGGFYIYDASLSSDYDGYQGIGGDIMLGFDVARWWSSGESPIKVAPPDHYRDRFQYYIEIFGHIEIIEIYGKERTTLGRKWDDRRDRLSVRCVQDKT